ncbi:MAG: hypothetical protein WC863_00435 [Patescibacteria group bacterium]
MRTYFWNRGSLIPGISVTKDDKLGFIVYLGEDGRGRRYEKVGLLRNNPAEIIDGKIFEAHPVRITVGKGTDKERNFFVLAKSIDNADPRVIVHVNTECVYTRDTVGKWTMKVGAPETIVKAYGAHGIAGRIGNWDDGLILMKPGDVLEIRPEGGHKVDSYALFFDAEGILTSMVWKDYEAMQAISGGEVDWL